MKVRCPVLALNGEKDVQVPAKENLAIIEEALKVGGNTQFTVREFPGLNHGFQTAESVQHEETISPVVLTTIADWIIANTGAPVGNAQ